MTTLGPIELLGSVVLRSGDLVLVDFGLLRMWSHDSEPLMLSTDADDATVSVANDSADLEIVGADASMVADLLDLASVRGVFAFDVPRHGVPWIRDQVAAVCAEHGLVAEIQEIERMPHAVRARRLLQSDPDGTEVIFHGQWAIAVRGLPVGRPLQVRGQRMDPSGPDAGRWWSIWIELDHEAIVKTSVEVGYVLVDEARLMFGDLESLGEWSEDVSLDGLADVVFWGADASTAAAALSAPSVEEFGREIHGWLDLPVDDAQRRANDLMHLRDGGHRFRIDVRMHDRHNALLAQARRSPTESGEIDLDGTRCVGFFTSWGDGAFPVFWDLDDNGDRVRLRVELGAAEIVRRTRRFEELWFGELSKLAMVSARVTRDGEFPRWIYREPAMRDQDSGWRVFAGDETDEYSNDAHNVELVPLRELIKDHAVLEALFRHEAPIAFEWNGQHFEATRRSEDADDQ